MQHLPRLCKEAHQAVVTALPHQYPQDGVSQAACWHLRSSEDDLPIACVPVLCVLPRALHQFVRTTAASVRPMWLHVE